jgi:type IV fimbrial biogenesis protein FimT
MKSLRQGGLTLIELLVVLSIAVILMALAAPSFNETLRRNRIETAANGLLSALNFARTEAIRRGVSITVRKTGEALLRRWDALPAGYTLRTNSNNFANYIRYNARGEIANNSTGGYFIVCFNGQLKGAKAIVLTPVRAVMAGDLDGNGIPESDSGNINSCN